MEFFPDFFVRGFFYVLFGLVMEVGSNALGRLFSGGWSVGKKLEGDVSLWMIPVYFFGILFFEQIYVYFLPFADWIRFIIWMVLISGIEVITGIFFVKVFKFCPWDYRSHSDVLFGFTRVSLLFQWGLCGLILENFVTYILKIVGG